MGTFGTAIAVRNVLAKRPRRDWYFSPLCRRVGIGPASRKANIMSSDPEDPQTWDDVAESVAKLIRKRAKRDLFVEFVHDAANAALAVSNENELREQARRRAMRESGVWWPHQGLPGKPPEEAKHHWVRELSGRIDLPEHIAPPSTPEPPDRPTPSQQETFDYVKGHGFPDDRDGKHSYAYWVEGWLPDKELLPEHDPDDGLPLPVPSRTVLLPERFAALAAIHDNIVRGDERLGPASEICDDPESIWYSFLVLRVAELKSFDLPIEVRGWLANVQEELELAGKKQKKPRKRGPKGPRSGTADDQKVYDGWKHSCYKNFNEYAVQVHKAKTPAEVKKLLDAKERHRKRLSRKRQN